MLVESNSKRRIRAVHGRLAHDGGRVGKKAQRSSPLLLQLRPKKAHRRKCEALGLGERSTFMGHNKRNVLHWMPSAPVSARHKGWAVVADLDATLQWPAACGRPLHRHCCSFTNLLPNYVDVLPRGHHSRCAKVPAT